MDQHEAESLLGFAIGPGWSFQPVLRDGKRAGFFMVMANEIHAWRDPAFTGCWVTRGDFRAVAKPLLDRFGTVTTKVRKSNEVGQRFVERLGFQKIQEEGEVIHYKARSIKHAGL